MQSWPWETEHILWVFSDCRIVRDWRRSLTTTKSQTRETNHEASSEASSTPLCNIGLNRKVRPNGTLAVRKEAEQIDSFLHKAPFVNDRSRALTGEEAREGPVNPSSNHNHRNYISNIAFHHVYHHAGIWNGGEKRHKNRAQSWKFRSTSKQVTDQSWGFWPLDPSFLWRNSHFLCCWRNVSAFRMTRRRQIRKESEWRHDIDWGFLSVLWI